MRPVFSLTKSRSTRCASDRSWYSSEGAGAVRLFARRSCHSLRRYCRSFSSSASVAVSAMVRMMKPPVSSGQHLLQLVAQLRAPALVLDALRDADVRVLRQVHQHPAGDADLGREARALGADRILDHLHQQRLALGRIFSIGCAAFRCRRGRSGAPPRCRRRAGTRRAPGRSRRRPTASRGARAPPCPCRYCPPGRGPARSMCSSCATPLCITATRVSCGVTLIRMFMRAFYGRRGPGWRRNHARPPPHGSPRRRPVAGDFAERLATSL